MVKGKTTPKNRKQLGNRIRGQPAQTEARDGGFPERCRQEEKETHIDLFNQIARSSQVLKEVWGYICDRYIKQIAQIKKKLRQLINIGETKSNLRIEIQSYCYMAQLLTIFIIIVM